MDSKNIFVWSPFTSKIGTKKCNKLVLIAWLSFQKLKNFNIKLINVFGEWK